MYKKGAGNDKQGKDAGKRTLCPYRNFSQAIIVNISKSGHKDAQYTTPFYANTGKPWLDIKLTFKISITVKERFSVNCVLFESKRKFYDGTGHKIVPNKRTCIRS